MTLLWPWSLLAGTLVVGAALWALYKPWRQLAVVGSLKLWEKALGALGRRERQRSRRVSLSWLCLLTGAVAVVLAVANPVYFNSSPARRVVIAPVASAELAGPGGAKELRSAVAELLDRLGPRDQVQLLLPLVPPKSDAWLTPDQAKARLADLKLFPARAADILPQAEVADSQHVYYFVPAGAKTPAGPGISAIELTTRLSPVVFKAIGAEAMPGGKAQVFLAVGAGQLAHPLLVEATGVSAAGQTPGQPERWTPPRQNQFVREMAACEAMAFTAVGDGLDGPGASAYLVRRHAEVRKVAMIGPDNPLVRRFIEVDPSLLLVGSADRADVIVANGISPPPDKPALVIAPPTEPVGWRWGKWRQNLPLRQADVTAAGEVMRDVYLDGVVVRRLRTWIPGDQTTQKVPAAYQGEALILQDGGEETHTQRRVYVSFGLDARNTNFGMTADFVVFLSNVVRYLAPGGQGKERYEYETPLQAGPQKDWTRLAGTPAPASADTTLPWPGIYRDRDGRLHAVNLLDLAAGAAKPDIKAAVAALPLPPPEQRGFTLAIWPMLLGAGLLLWLLGWWLRLR